MKGAQRIAIVAVVALMVLHESHAQRPSYAGGRPVGGLSQKHKYHATTINSEGQIVNRFGEADSTFQSNTVAFGVEQRPPVGLNVVAPQSAYFPLPVASTAPQFAVNDRFGGAPTQATATTSNAGAGGASSTAATAGSTAASSPPPLPLDALGDRELINQLNIIPADARPFWFLNYQAIEAHRNGSPSFGGPVTSQGSFFG